MSPLWRENQNTKNKKKKGYYAEKIFQELMNCISHAQVICRFFFGSISQRFSIQKKSIEGTSPRMSCKVFASMTVEAALVLPLFMLFFLNLGSTIEIMRLHAKVEMAMWETGREICLYGTALRGTGVFPDTVKWESGGELAQALENIALTQGYVRGRMEEYLGNDYLSSAPLEKGKADLHYPGSELLTDNDQVELVVTYPVCPKWQVRGFRSFWLENHYYGRLWTGYDISQENGVVYYLAENNEVYHLDRECSHLRLNPQVIFVGDLNGARNAKGCGYRACLKCIGSEELLQVWISPEGDCYHSCQNCPGLKRTVRAVSWEEARRYRPCSRCGHG